MSISARRRIRMIGWIALGVFPLGIPLAAHATEPASTPLTHLLQLAQASEDLRDEDFESCATNCQRHLDQQTLNCSGYKNRGPEGARLAPASPTCRQDANAAFKSCFATCHERWPGKRERYRG